MSRWRIPNTTARLSELALIAMLADDQPPKAIAAAVGCEHKTIDHQLHRLRLRHQVRTNTGLVAKAIRERLIK
ncbi:MAG: hypothetical protein FJX76_01505 [Armatimonadetes bacterium]|nr:hypothetical protein [Armatimonadota bacterium]MBM3738934.1 hypothetical protein [Acidobacteriota bacterium]